MQATSCGKHSPRRFIGCGGNSLIGIDRFVEGLCGIREAEFTVPNVMDFLRGHRVDAASLAPYVRFEPTHYTRNLIHRTGLFEVMTICWEIGQGSSIHNHQNQNCWMAAAAGRLTVQNYEQLRSDASTGHCELREADRVVMDGDNPAFVDPARPIHSVLNLEEYGERAVSLHIYSRPYDHCLVYSLQTNTCRDVPLFFDTEYGRSLR